MNSKVDTATLRQLDQSHHLHPFTDFKDYANHGGRIVNKAEHIYIYDSEGHKMLDGMSGLWCCNLGYSQQSIVDAVTEQMQKLPYYNSFFQCANPPAIELAAAIAEVAPEHMNHVFFTGVFRLVTFLFFLPQHKTRIRHPLSFLKKCLTQ